MRCSPRCSGDPSPNDAPPASSTAEPHYYLEFLGTAPEHQGRGLGGQLLTPMMRRCDDEGVGANLESSKESNVAFHRRYGFEVTEVITHRAGVQQWLMWRESR